MHLNDYLLRLRDDRPTVAEVRGAEVHVGPEGYRLLRALSNCREVSAVALARLTFAAEAQVLARIPDGRYAELPGVVAAQLTDVVADLRSRVGKFMRGESMPRGLRAGRSYKMGLRPEQVLVGVPPNRVIEAAVDAFGFQALVDILGAPAKVVAGAQCGTGTVARTVALAAEALLRRRGLWPPELKIGGD